MELANILIAPVVTEKSTAAQAARKYVFRVNANANKVQVAQAVEAGYGVKVESVNIIPVLRKVRLVGRGREMTKRPAAKKAIVTLQPKQTLDFNKVKTDK